MCTVNYVNITLEQGVSQEIEFLYKDDITGLPVDVVGMTATLYVRPFADMPASIILTESDGISLLSGGMIKVTFIPSYTSTADWDQAPYDLTLNDGGRTVKLSKGLVTINPSQFIGI